MIKKAGIGIALLMAAALGGAAIAGAVQNNSPNAQQGQQPRQRNDETALTGETAEKVRAAALAKVPGGTVDRLEADGDGNAAYEAHMTKADGSRITVYVNQQFEVVGTEEGRGHGPGRGGSNETALIGDTAAQVRAAALAGVPGATVDRLETDSHGNAAYEAHMTKADGSRITVYVNQQFDVVEVEEAPQR